MIIFFIQTQSYEIKEYLEEFKEEHQWDYDEWFVFFYSI